MVGGAESRCFRSGDLVGMVMDTNQVLMLRVTPAGEAIIEVTFGGSRGKLQKDPGWMLRELVPFK